MAKRKTKEKSIRLSDHVGMSRRFAMRGRYDAAQTTDENRIHFAAADGYSSDAANNLGVRTILRNRCRYVFANNTRAKGMIRTVANHTIGTGPRLQMELGEGVQARKLSAKIEGDFGSWSKQINLSRKLRILRTARAISGEIFGVLGINPEINHPVKLDIRLVETDRVTNPDWDMDAEDVDGVSLDQFDNPTSYRILKTHPGDTFQTFGPDDWQDFPARIVLHYFNQERPEQHRGIPDITPAVQLFEEARRFRAAVLAASESAADFAMAIQTDAPPDGPAAAEPMDELELTRRKMTVLPMGWKLTQTKAEQPQTNYKEFQRELLSEIARCLDMPLSLASLDANDANMSSSYVINQPYETAITVDRGDIDAGILDPILDAYLTLAFDPSGTPISRRMPSEFPHTWYWPLIQSHADPAKVANADDTSLSAGTTSRSRVYAKKGLDVDLEDERAAKDYGMSVEEYRKTLAQRQFKAPQPQQPGAPEDETKEAIEEEV